MFAQIDKRLRQATGKNEFFGGMSMILVGDPGQLLPVGGSPLYNFPPKNSISAHGLMCYQQFVHAFKLDPNNPNPSRVKNISDDNFSGLMNYIYLAINSRITLTSNLWTSKGLVNGASGYVKDIIYEENNNLPHTIFIEFENYTGPTFFPCDDPPSQMDSYFVVVFITKMLEAQRHSFLYA